MIERTACLITAEKDIYTHQAVERLLMETLPDATALLYLYEASRSVVLGNKEEPAEVCRLNLLEAAGGVQARRLSGGGAWFVSPGVLNFSLIVPKEDFDIQRQTLLLSIAAASLGLNIYPGKNHSLLYGERILCRNAYYKGGNIGLHHGVILCDADLGQLALYLKDREASHAINLSQVNPQADIPQTQQALANALGQVYHSEPVWLDGQLLDTRSVSRYAEAFRDPKWLAGTSLQGGIRIAESFPWGNISVTLCEREGIIRDVAIHTDAMESAWFGLLEQSLKACPFLISAITGRFAQNIERVQDLHLKQIAGDLCRLICAHLRQNDRNGES